MSGCLTELAIARFIDGVADAAEREAAILHLADCADCRRTIYDVNVLIRDHAVSKPRKRYAAGALVAAAAIVLVIAMPRGTVTDRDREPTFTASDAPALITPVGEVTAARALTWGSISGAEQYRVRLFDAKGSVLFETESNDTSVALPSSVTLQPGASYLWRVDVRTGFDRWTSSEMVEFHIIQTSLGDSLRRAGNNAYKHSGPVAAIAIWRRAYAASLSAHDSNGLAATAGNIGAAYARLGNLDSASHHLQNSRVIAHKQANRRLEASALSELAGLLESAGGSAAEIRNYYTQSLALRQQIGDTRGIAADYNNLASLAVDGGDFVEARRQLTAALAINRRAGFRDATATNLLNLANLSSMEGDFGAASAQYKEALNTWRSLEQWPDVADGLRALANLELRRGDYPGAQEHLMQSLYLYNRAGMQEDALVARQELVAARVAGGDLQHALDDLGRALTIADKSSADAATRAGLILSQADIAHQLSAFPQADQFYQQAGRLYARAGDDVGEAEASVGRAALFLERKNPLRAKELLEHALIVQKRSGNQRAVALTQLQLGTVAGQRDDIAAARRHFDSATNDLMRLGDPVGAAAAIGTRAELEASAGSPANAEALYRRAIAMVGNRSVPIVEWSLHAGLGFLQRDRGAVDDAIRELRLAIASIERVSAPLSLAERRSAFLTDKWDVYGDLAALEHARGRPEAAFALSERLRAGEMRELLTRGRIASTGASARLVQQEQDLRRRIAELNSDLKARSERNTTRGPDVSRANAAQRETLLQAEQSYTDLLLEMRQSAPAHVRLISNTPSSSKAIVSRLATDEVFIEYLISEKSALAFVITRDTMAVVQLGMDRHELVRLVDFVRGTLVPHGNARLDSLWRAPLQQLHSALISPIADAGLLKNKTRLTIVPHRELHYLPFSALLSPGAKSRYLIESYQVSLVPSASVWLTIAERKKASGHGTVAFAPQPRELPASRMEVEAVRRTVGRDASVYLGANASEATLRRVAPDARIIHLATYGVLNKQNPLFSYVAFAPSRGDDGRLDAHEVFGMSISADLVVLSACQTALASGAISDVPAGDDWVGLSRAFLAAGARRVVASLWPVQDRATAELMRRFYGYYMDGDDPARALAAAQRSLLKSNATAHPYYWAGFEVIGGR